MWSTRSSRRCTTRGTPCSSSATTTSFPTARRCSCTIQGDVWRVEGLDETLEKVRWKRFASGLHQALGLVVADGKALRAGTRPDHPAARLQRRRRGRFLRMLLQRVSDVHRRPRFHQRAPARLRGPFLYRFEQVGVAADRGRRHAHTRSSRPAFAIPTASAWHPTARSPSPIPKGNGCPTSMICEVRPGGHYGYPGPKDNQPPDLPLVYLPRGLDNSSGAQVTVPDGRFGPLHGQLIHFSFGTGTHFLVLREKVDGQSARSSRAVARRVSFRVLTAAGSIPRTASSMSPGWPAGALIRPADGCFQRVRYTGGPVQLPTAFHAHENGVLLTFSRPLERGSRRARRNVISPRPGTITTAPATARPSCRPGTRVSPATTCWRSARPMCWPTAARLFLEIPDLQPVNQLAPARQPGCGASRSTCSRRSTSWRRRSPASPAIQPSPKTIAAHPILADMVALNHRPAPNPWRRQARRVLAPITIEAGKNLSYSVRSFKVRAGEPIKLTFMNPDSVPHNWALIKPGTLTRVGDLVNKIIAEPDAASRHYIPRTERCPRLHRHRRAAGPDHDLVPRPDCAGALSLSLHVPGPLDGHEWGDDRRVASAQIVKAGAPDVPYGPTDFSLASDRPPRRGDNESWHRSHRSESRTSRDIAGRSGMAVRNGLPLESPLD